MSLGIDPTKRKPIKEPNLFAQQLKSGDFTSSFAKIGDEIGNRLRAGDVTPPSNAAAGL